jgi:hypothetical protein
MSSLGIVADNEFRLNLEKIRAEDDPTDWVLLSYEGNHSVKVRSFGSGGLKDFNAHLDPSEVQFGVLSFLVEGDGDGYKTPKNILITWLGPKVPGGLRKARAAAHRKQLRDFIQDTLTVACELQASSLEELNENMVGQAISRTRGGVYSTARATSATAKQAPSSPQNRSASRLVFADLEGASTALKRVAETKNAWTIFAYVKNKKDEIENILSGDGGFETLAQNWPPPDRVYFCYVSIIYTASDGFEQNKFILVTLIGSEVPPLSRARTSGQKKEIIDYIKISCPYHTEFQPSDVSELKLSEVIVKFK